MFQMSSWHKLINFKTSAGFLRKHGVYQTVLVLSSALLVDMLIQKGNEGTCCSYCQEFIDWKVAQSCCSTLFFFFFKGSSYEVVRQPSPLGLCTCVCWKRCLTWKPPPVPPPAPKVQPIARGGQIFRVLSDRIFNSIFFISEPSHVPACLSYLYSNCLNIVSDGDVSIWICREERCCGGMFNWLPAEQ